MKYLKIQNKGVLPMSLFFLLGASTKSEDNTKIGEFGTGLKYALAFCARTQTPLTIFLGERELKIEVRPLKVRSRVFNCVFIVYSFSFK